MANEGVERCDAASGILFRDSGTELAEASDPMAGELDRIQLELGEGPCLHACRTSSPVSSHDLIHERRWPAFRVHARRHGIGAIVSVPLLPAREYPSWCGWLTLYSRRPGAFPPASLALAQALGLYCSNTVDADLHARNLQAALASRDLIGQAKGIIMARRDVDEDQAFEILKRTSQDSNRRLRDVAEAVVRFRGRSGPR